MANASVLVSGLSRIFDGFIRESPDVKHSPSPASLRDQEYFASVEPVSSSARRLLLMHREKMVVRKTVLRNNLALPADGLFVDRFEGDMLEDGLMDN
ncbi:MAG: hypothetical protein HGA62_04520 [Chlorobiaceae bacterium]|nr:hypothetical protein [Chlorobiaceae bacterium]NTV60391.1 hypothetical protein [Chlorobiaceae bacterium]